MMTARGGCAGREILLSWRRKTPLIARPRCRRPNMHETFVRARRNSAFAPTRACRRFHHPDFNAREMQGWKALDAEGRLPGDGWRREQKWALDMGLPGAESLTDQSIPTFARGEL